MPREVADALKKQGALARRQERAGRRPPPSSATAQRDEAAAMIVETGHFALVLALALALRPVVRAALGQPHAAIARADGRRAARPRSRNSCSSPCLCGADLRACRLRLLARQRRRELAFDQAAHLQDHRRLGQPRRLDAALGPDPRALRRAGRASRAQHARRICAPIRSPCRPGSPRRSCSSSCSPPIPSRAIPSARRGQRSQSAAAGPRPRHPSAAALSRLCRVSRSPSPSPRRR